MEIYFPTGEAVVVTLIPPVGSQLQISTVTTPPNEPVPSAPSPYTMEYVYVGSALSSIVIGVAPTARDFSIASRPIAPSASGPLGWR